MVNLLDYIAEFENFIPIIRTIVAVIILFIIFIIIVKYFYSKDAIIEFALSLLYPGRCSLCREASMGPLTLCSECIKTLPYNLNPCPVCAQPLAGQASPPLPCGACQNTPPALDRSVVPLLYRPPVDRLVQGMKFHQQLFHGQTLAGLLAKKLADHPLDVECLVPVPLHPSRLRQRGYNQAQQLAWHLSKMLALPVEERRCRRTIDTAPQAGAEAT